MLLYIIRVILVFWIISTLLRWIERFIKPSGGQQSTSPPPQNTPVDPTTTPPMGRIVDAEFEDLDGSA